MDTTAPSTRPMSPAHRHTPHTRLSAPGPLAPAASASGWLAGAHGPWRPQRGFRWSLALLAVRFPSSLVLCGWLPFAVTRFSLLGGQNGAVFCFLCLFLPLCFSDRSPGLRPF